MNNLEKLVIALAGSLLVSLLVNYPIMWLINYIISPTALLVLFGVAKITFWKTFALNVTTGLLTRGRSK